MLRRCTRFPMVFGQTMLSLPFDMASTPPIWLSSRTLCLFKPERCRSLICLPIYGRIWQESTSDDTLQLLKHLCSSRQKRRWYSDRRRTLHAPMMPFPHLDSLGSSVLASIPTKSGGSIFSSQTLRPLGPVPVECSKTTAFPVGTHSH